MMLPVPPMKRGDNDEQRTGSPADSRGEKLFIDVVMKGAHAETLNRK